MCLLWLFRKVEVRMFVFFFFICRIQAKYNTSTVIFRNVFSFILLTLPGIMFFGY